MRQRRSGGGWAAIIYALRKAHAVGFRRMWTALRSRNACKTCALGMGGQLGGMVNEKGRFPEVCKKSIQAMAADLQGAIHEHFFDDFSLQQLRAFSPRELEAAGRLTTPMYAGPLDSHYRPIEWDKAFDTVARKLKKTDPRQAFFYFSGRSSNEAGFLMQLFARLWGTNNVNNCSYFCHQASGVALASVIGSGTATITLDDLDHLGEGDVLFLIGANPASNHPRLMRTLVDLKRRGGKVIVVNPLKEPGLVRFKVPSDIRSLLLGSTIADEYVQPHIGGDIALLAGLAKAIIERGSIAQEYLNSHVDGWPEFRRYIDGLAWRTISEHSGVERAAIRRVAELYAGARNAVFCWAMGITHHEHGVRNVQMIANIALMRGMVGAPGRGLLPLRGHSNVQGMGSMGVTPYLRQAVFDRLEKEFNVKLPDWPGMDTLSCVQAAHAGAVKFASCLGGNLFGSNPDSMFAHEAMSKIDLVLYMSTTLNTGHAWGRGKETIILPVLARDEEPQPTTQESMFNYVRLSDGAAGSEINPALPRYIGPRSEIQIIASIAAAVLDQPGEPIGYPSQPGAALRSRPLQWSTLKDHSHIRQLIARIIPGYEQLGDIDRTRKEFTIGGRILHEPRFATDNGRAKMHVIELPPLLGNGEAQAPPAMPRRGDPASTAPPGGRGGERGMPPGVSPTRIASAPSAGRAPSLLRMTTLRSEGQFNTVVYEDHDLYRGQDRRDVIMMSRMDIDMLRLKVNQRVTVRSQTGAMAGMVVRAIDIPQGNCAMYYPEANALVPRIADPHSHTPRFKSTLVWIELAPEGDNGALPRSAEHLQIDTAHPSAKGSSRSRMKAC